MRAVAENVQFCGNIVLAAGEIKGDRIFSGNDGVLVAGIDERLGSVLGDLLLVGKRSNQILWRVIAKQIILAAFVCAKVAELDDGVAGNAEIGTATRALDGISGRWIASVEVCHHRGTEMTACGETHHADFSRVDAKFRRARADCTDGPLSVVHRDRVAVAAF